MFKKILTTLMIFSLYGASAYVTNASEAESGYTELKVVDAGTFNEFRYRITDEFLNFRNKYEVDGRVNATSANKILDLAKKGYNYLPDSLSNKNYYNHLKTSIELALKYPSNSSNYSSVVTAIENFLEKTNIQAVTGRVEAFPSSGNAPLTVTLRGNVTDPTGTQIPDYNYTWWMYENGKRKVLGDNISFTHVFKEEGNFAVFLDVKSAHKNSLGYTDVLPFSSRADITIKEKVASVIIKVNGITLRNDNEIKFTPEEARYGLLFDATSSTPTDGAEFIKTTWEFGNGETREYSGDPRVERVVYAKEGEFTVKLTLKTNELKQIERKFVVNVHNPIATINASSEEGYMGDKFTFSAQNNTSDKDLTYSWEIIDLNKDEVIFRKSGNLFTYSFSDKGKYNVKMTVTEPSGESDIDTQIIYINSRPPVADFISSIPLKNKPNRVFLDATKSYDPDFSDDGNLEYSWIIDGDRVDLEDPNFNGSNGYFTFDSVGDHSVVLEVEDPDGISAQKSEKVNVKSILSVEFFAFPRVAQRLNTLRFVSSSPEARFYEWDFGDGNKKGGADENISHKYEKSGIFNVKLTVRDEDDNVNTFTKNVYIGDSNSPYSFISVLDQSRNDTPFDESACDGAGAYLVNRVDTVLFSAKESINIDGESTGLTYSWKLGNESYKNSQEFSKKFDELGCFPIKLTVKSDDNGRTHSTTTYIKVENKKPVLSSLDVKIVDDSTDPVVVNVSALGAKDEDGVIQSYLWYYYTDIDSEPQDFRATKTSSTSFVLPKITGNYYFVVVMKDNNEERIDSEEITGSKYFITLTGDNLNTPLVKLKVDDSSVAIGDELTFTANVENILGQDLSKKVSYSWDFDGDGFYDRETTTNIVTYKYTGSGEKHVKVKAKYKGFSNTKTITVNVSNVLKPDFGYISIGNTFIFFDKTIGTVDNIEWNLGDSTVIKDKKYIVHTYEDGEVSHLVNLKVSEGTKLKEINAKVVKNVKNMILANRDGLVAFAEPKIDEEGQITVNEAGDFVHIYLGESKGDIANYAIDYDIDYDSDLNGGNDDDEDNIKLDSYTSGDAIKVDLNENKYQTIRVFTKNSSGELLDSKDILIVKEYIQEDSIDVDSIVFEGVSENVKLEIERLKSYISDLPKEYKLKGLMYVQKLQEEWNDDREKTNVILEFEGYISETGVSNSDDIINLLEGLLVEDQSDKSEKAITFNALKNLIPQSIFCTDSETGEKTGCYNELVVLLETIRDNSNIDENRALGTKILEVIATDEVMTNKEKTDFKAILKTFVYGGVSNIPEEEVQEVVEETNNSSSSSVISLFLDILFWLFVIFGAFAFVVLAYYIYYLVVNTDKNIGFQDFIIEKTSGVKATKTNGNTDGLESDILEELTKEVEIKDEVLEKAEQEQKEEVKEEEVDNSEASVESKDEDVPEWLKGNFSDENFETKEESKEETLEHDAPVEDKLEEANNLISDEEKADVPEWLKGSFEETAKTEESSKEEQEESKEEETIQDDIKEESFETKEEASKEDLEKVTKVEDSDIPDWLKGSFEETTKTEESSEEEKVQEEAPKVEEKTDNIPDWLKGSFEETTKTEESSEEEKVQEEAPKVENVVKEKEQEEEKKSNLKTEKKEEKVDKNVSKKAGNNSEKVSKIEEKEESSGKKQEVKTTKKPVSRKKTPRKTSDNNNSEKTNKADLEKTKQDNKKTNTKQELNKETKTETNKANPAKKSKSPKTNKNSKTENKSEELWDDGMTIPDWLKTDDEK